MGNFFSDVAGGFLGEGPGTDTVSGYEMLGAVGQRGNDIMRGYLSEDPNDVTNLGRGRAIFAPNYEAISEGEMDERVGRIGGAYKEMFNPFLANLQQRIDADLSRSGLLTSTRSAALRSKTLADLAVQSYLPQAEYRNQLEEQNRQDIWNRRMALLGQAMGDTTPNTVEIAKPSSMERGLGAFAGRAAGTWATGGFGGGGFGGLGSIFSSPAPNEYPNPMKTYGTPRGIGAQ